MMPPERQAGDEQMSTGAGFFALLLLLAVVCSAVAVNYSVHKNRKLFAELQTLQKQADHLQVEWGQLLLEESSQAAHQRIEAKARQELQMEVPPLDSIAIIEL